MNKITLLGTAHNETGKCTSANLYTIIESIDPDLIFEELTHDHYKEVYEESPELNPRIESLECRAVREYVKNNNIAHIPVDTLKRDKRGVIIEDLEDLITRRICSADFKIDTSFSAMYERYKYMKYKKLSCYINEQYAKKGFEYMNTAKADNLLIKKHRLLKKYIYNHCKEIIGLHKAFVKLHFEDRENEMTDNINKYFAENKNCFNAVLLIGAAHRVSIKKKLKKMRNVEFDFYYRGIEKNA